MMKNILIAAALILSAAFCSASCKTSGPVCDPRGQAASDYMYEHFGDRDSALQVWLDGDYGEHGRLWLEGREHKFEALEKWASNIQNPQDREAWLGAIQYYEDGAKDGYAEWHTHKTQRTQAAYEEHLRECAEVARKLAASKKPLPTPPDSLLEERTTTMRGRRRSKAGAPLRISEHDADVLTTAGTSGGGLVVTSDASLVLCDTTGKCVTANDAAVWSCKQGACSPSTLAAPSPAKQP